MTKSTTEILNSTFGEVEDQSFTYAEALDHYTVVVRQATSVGSAKTQQKKLLDVSTFLVKLHAEFGGDTKLYGACIRKAGFYKPLMKRFGKSANSEASKMLWIGAVAPTVQKFIEATARLTSVSRHRRLASSKRTMLGLPSRRRTLTPRAS